MPAFDKGRAVDICVAGPFVRRHDGAVSARHKGVCLSLEV